MFQLYRKNKAAIFLILLVLTGTAALVVSGITLNNNSGMQFLADGYFLGVEADDTNKIVPELTNFMGGSSIRTTAESGYRFKDYDGNYTIRGNEDFFYYGDGSISSLEGMLLVDVQNFQAGIMDHYYLNSMMVLGKEQDSFYIDNNQTDLKFSNFLLKTGNCNYVVVSPSMTFKASAGAPEQITGNMVHLTYSDEFGTVFSMTDGTKAWQSFSKGCTLTLQNGAVLNLGDMLVHNNRFDEEAEKYQVQLKLTDIEVSAASAIQVASASASSWKPLTFIANAVHGVEGLSGKDGDPGIDGKTGQEGKEGDEGKAGGKGTKGKSKGSGQAGAKGKQGTEGKTLAESNDDASVSDPEFIPRVNVAAWSQDAANVTIKLVAEHTDTILESTSEAYIQEIATGKRMNWPDLELKSVDMEGIEYTFNQLQPGGQYRFVVTAQIRKDGDESIAATTMLTRDFTTDSLGFYVEKVSAHYVTDKDLAQNKYNTTQKGAALGLRTTISGGQEITKIWNATLEATDQSYNYTLSEEECKALIETQNKDTKVMFFGLPSNKNIKLTLDVEVKNKASKVYSETYSVTYLTLKATPEAYGVTFDVNENRYFVSMVSVRDTDEAVVNYIHEVYKYDSVNQTLFLDECMKKKTTTATTTSFYQDLNILADGTLYANRVFVTWYDNEKYVTKEAEFSESWTGKNLTQQTLPYISFAAIDNGIEDPGIKDTSVRIRLEISPGSGNTIYVGEKRVLVQFTAANYTETRYFDSLNGWNHGTLTGESMNGDTEFSETSWTPEITVEGLRADTTYIVTVMAYIGSQNAQEVDAEQKTIGTTMIKTTQ